MPSIVFSLNNSEDYLEDNFDVISIAGFPELKQLKEYWLLRFKKYIDARGFEVVANSPEWIQIDFEPVPSQGIYVYQFQLDGFLFNQVALAYAQYGWKILSILESVTFDKDTLPRISPAGQTLIQATIKLFLDNIYETLSGLEEKLTKYAHKKWDESIQKLKEYQNQFENLNKLETQAKPNFRIKNRELANGIFKEVKQYDDLTKKIEKLQRDRAKVDRNGRYIPGKNDSSYWNMYRTFGKAELQHNAERLKIANTLFEKFPPAVFVLDELQEFIRKADIKSFQGVELATSYNQSDFEKRVYSKLLETINGLRDLKKEISKPNQVSTLKKDSVNSSTGLETLIAKSSIDTLEKQLKAFQTISSLSILGPILLPIAIMDWDVIRGLDKNPIMGFQSLVQEYWQQIVKTEPTSWNRVVFESYQDALITEINYQIQLDKKVALIIKLIKFIEAVVSILAMIVSVVATEGAALPWAVSVVCTVIETANNVMTIALLSVMVVELKLGSDENQKIWRESLLLLSFEDVDTIRRVGSVLNRLEFYGISITVEIVKMLIKAKFAKMNSSVVEKYGLPDELDLIRKAIDLENLAGDLETLIVDSPLLVKLKEK